MYMSRMVMAVATLTIALVRAASAGASLTAEPPPLPEQINSGPRAFLDPDPGNLVILTKTFQEAFEELDLALRDTARVSRSLGRPGFHTPGELHLLAVDERAELKRELLEYGVCLFDRVQIRRLPEKLIVTY